MDGMITLTLAGARKNANLSQKELANALGITTATLSLWENGVSEPRISQARKISKIVNIPLDALIFMPDKSN